MGVELAAERGGELIGRSRRMLLAPCRHGGTRPGQVLRVLFPESHGRSLDTGFAW
ncbi:MAG: hypothetical protein ACRDOH_07030 [Streptosporangiaceae bacterium]